MPLRRKSKPRKPISQIRGLREKQGMTQEELAHMWGVSINTLREWETKPSKADNLVQLILLCRLFCCSPIELIGNVPPSNTTKTSDLEQFHQRLSQPDDLSSNNSCLQTKIAELRKSKNLTQSQIAKALEVSVHTIQNWERQRTSPRQFIQFIKLCKLLKCKLEELEELVDYIPEEKLNAIQNLLYGEEGTVPATEKSLKEIQESINPDASQVGNLIDSLPLYHQLEEIE